MYSAPKYQIQDIQIEQENSTILTIKLQIFLTTKPKKKKKSNKIPQNAKFGIKNNAGRKGN